MLQAFFTKAHAGLALLFVAALLGAAPAQASDFNYNAATRSIAMKGTILVEDAAKFRALLRAHPETQSIELLGSVGGEYTSSLEISLEVKKRRLHTVSTSFCHSGCAYIWLAGATRSVAGDAPKIHLPYANATGEVYPKLTYSWFAALGLSRDFADAVVSGVGPDNNWVKLTPAFLSKFGGSGDIQAQG
jgi:hypothetical protein